MLSFIIHALGLGIGATVVMDLVAWTNKRFFGVSGLDYALVGRWIGHLAKGRTGHAHIANSSPVAFETAIGWSAHYAIGALFAAMFLRVVGMDWPQDPSLLPAVLFGGATVIAPFAILQPAMGAGLAASRTAKPNLMRGKSLFAHVSFGFGLWIAAFAVTAVR